MQDTESNPEHQTVSSGDVPAAGPVIARPVLESVVPPLRLESPLELRSLSRAQAALDLGLVALTLLVVPFGFQLLVEFWAAATGIDPGGVLFDPEKAGPQAAWLITVQKWFDAALAAGLLGYLLLRHRLDPAGFGLRFDRPLRQLGWAIATLASSYLWILVTVVIIGLVLLFFPRLEKDLLERVRLIDILPTDSLSRMVLLLLPVAVHEEVVFRGLLLPYLRRVLGSWRAAVALSSGVFAVLHLDQGWVGVLQVFGIGVVWAVFFLASRSLLPVTLAHLAFDLVQMNLMRLVPQELTSPENGGG